MKKIIIFKKLNFNHTSEKLRNSELYKFTHCTNSNYLLIPNFFVGLVTGFCDKRSTNCKGDRSTQKRNYRPPVSSISFRRHSGCSSCRRRFLGYLKLTRESTMMHCQLRRLTSH